MILESVGWTQAWQNAFASWAMDGLQPARICREHRGAYHILSDSGESLAEVSGRLRHQANGRLDYPAVGDWVAVDGGAGTDSRRIIHGMLPRHSAFIRRAAGKKLEEQAIAANVDVVFLVAGLDLDFNIRRIERYLTLAYESGALPVIVLNKADLCAGREQILAQVEASAYGVPVIFTSAATGEGLAALRAQLQPGMTGALLGSSGVGKSSLINTLLGAEALKTSAVREHDSRGRHTTTQRQLIPLPGGAAMIDTPGMRELQLLADASSLSNSFDEIAGLAGQCRFRDCSHTGEPGCAVQQALAQGLLETERYESYLRLRKELLHQQVEQDIHLQIAEKKRWKAIFRSIRHNTKRTGLE